MPIEFHYAPEKKALFGSMTGTLSVDDYRSAVETIVRSEEFPADVRTLWDLRELDFDRISRGFQKELVEISEQFPQRAPAKVAFVVGSELGFGMIRMFEALAERVGYQTMVFRDYSEGEDWLLEET